MGTETDAASTFNHDHVLLIPASFMRLRRHRWIVFVAVLGIYALLPLVVFDFSSVAVPFDEETHRGRPVAIGPRPRAWVPGARNDYHVPGGFGYDAGSWPFRAWKPICLIYLKLRGYERPAEWR